MFTRSGARLLLLTGLVVLLGASAARAQFFGPESGKPRSGPSHVPLPKEADDVTDPKDAERLLAERLRSDRELAQIQTLLEDPALLDLARKMMKDPEKYGLTKEKIKQLQEANKDKYHPDLNNPAWQELLRKVDPGRVPEGKEKIQQLQDLLKSRPPDTTPSKPPDTPLSDPTPPMPMPPPMPPDQGQPGPLPAPMPPPMPPAEPDQPATAEERASRERFNKWLADNAERLGRTGAFTNTPAGEQLRKEIERLTGPSGQGLGLNDKASQWAAQLQLGKYLPSDQLPRAEWPKLLDPSWADRAPDLKWGGPHGGALPSLSGPGPAGPVSGGGGLLQVVLLIACVGGTVVLAALLWRRYQGEAARAAKAGWKLGPWPVNPADLRTREDVVKAFEYLSLLRLGRAARTRNHRELASELSRPEPAERRPAVGRVAGLYEQARYAPPGEELSEADLAAARRDISSLAGVPVA